MAKGNKNVCRLMLVGLISGVMSVALLFEWKLISSLLKLREMRVPYIASVFILISTALAIRSFRSGRKSLWICFGYGALTGQVAGTVSLSLANLFIQDGIGRNLETLHREGIFELLIMDASVAFVLGGWLIGAGAFVAYEILSRRYIDG